MSSQTKKLFTEKTQSERAQANHLGRTDLPEDVSLRLSNVGRSIRANVSIGYKSKPFSRSVSGPVSQSGAIFRSQTDIIDDIYSYAPAWMKDDDEMTGNDIDKNSKGPNKRQHVAEPSNRLFGDGSDTDIEEDIEMDSQNTIKASNYPSASNHPDDQNEPRSYKSLPRNYKIPLRATQSAPQFDPYWFEAPPE